MPHLRAQPSSVLSSDWRVGQSRLFKKSGLRFFLGGVCMVRLIAWVLVCSMFDVRADEDKNQTHPVITNSIGMALVLIPSGEFEMGRRQTSQAVTAKFAKWDAKGSDHSFERPPHRVQISQSFYLGQHEVTVGQFRNFVQDKSYLTEAERTGRGMGYDEATGFTETSKYTWKNPGFVQSDAHPVVIVSWHDAQSFCAWLSQKDGHPYRLPTEAEWEYACKAGTDTLWSNGDDPEWVARIGNVADGTIKATFSSFQTIDALDGYVFTAPVGMFPANRFGLKDMHGNVYEWCEDVYVDVYHQRSGTTIDPKQMDGSDFRVVRGGSWYSDPPYTRSCNRNRKTPNYSGSGAGFRVSRSE